MMVSMRITTSLKWASLIASLLTHTHVSDALAMRVDLRALLTDPARQWAANTTVSFPNSADFANATERWTIFRPPTYAAAVSPGTEADISKIVKLAASHEIPFLTRGAGHGYSMSLGDFQNGLALNLNHFKSISIDTAGQKVTIGPGVTAKDIYDPLYNAGFEIQTGTCSCPSLIGVTLGGGVGRFTGLHGLLIDALVSARVVTAKGDLIEVSENSYPDLFWGIRGAGPNFGVVTSATYKISPLVNQGNFLHADMYFPAEKSSAYFDVLEANYSNLPAKLAGLVQISWDSTANKTQIATNWVYFGPKDEGMAILKPILDIGPSLTDIRVVPWNKLVFTTGNGTIDPFLCRDNIIRDIRAVNQRKYSAETHRQAFAKMQKFLAETPGARQSDVVYELFPNEAMAAVPLSSTAFPWRDATGYRYSTLIYDQGDDALAAKVKQFGDDIRTTLQARSGYSGLSIFYNYARGDETLEQIYGKDKLPRLAKLKKTWDPNNLFAYNHPLPTHYP